MSQFRPVTLSCTPGAWRIFSARKTDPAFDRFAQKIFARDQHRCGYCGFQARQHQEIVNIDGNYANNQLPNMLTACCFCSQCFFIDAVGKSEYGGGTIIYMPEISQSQLSAFCHVLFCAMANATAYADQAQTIMRDFKLRAQEVERVLGEGMSQPSNLGQALTDARIKNTRQFQANLLKDLRLLPSRAKFESRIQIWSAEATNDLAESA